MLGKCPWIQEIDNNRRIGTGNHENGFTTNIFNKLKSLSLKAEEAVEAAQYSFLSPICNY